MPKIFIVSDINYPEQYVREVIDKLPSEDVIVYTYYSKQGNIIQKYCADNDIRVIKIVNDTNSINGIVQCINTTDSILIFYNHIHYCTGVDLIFKIGLTYNIPTLVYSEHIDLPLLYFNGKSIKSNTNLEKLCCFKSSKNKKIINYSLINYSLIENKKDTDLITGIEKLRTSYRNIEEQKKKREIIRIG